jgi:hypothetical protein
LESAAPVNSDRQHRYSPNPCGVSMVRETAPIFPVTEQNSEKNPGSNQARLQIDEDSYLQPRPSALNNYLDLTDNYLSTGCVKLIYIQR